MGELIEKCSNLTPGLVFGLMNSFFFIIVPIFFFVLFHFFFFFIYLSIRELTNFKRIQKKKAKKKTHTRIHYMCVMLRLNLTQSHTRTHTVREIKRICENKSAFMCV